MKHLLSITTLIISACMVSCTHSNAPAWSDETLDELDREYTNYLTSDIPEAREALRRSLKIIKRRDPQTHGYAHSNWITYARLHALEHRAGNHDIALLYFHHAKYWYMRRYEDREWAPVDITERLIEYTPSTNIKMMQEWDDKYREIGEQEPAE